MTLQKLMDPRYLAHLCAAASKLRNCHCKCSNGRPKAIFLTRELALRMAIKLRSMGRGRICVYECPAGIGYHLTHHYHQWLPGMRRSWKKPSTQQMKEEA